jgi:hypothetical protein
MVGDYCAWDANGDCFCDYIPIWCDCRSVSRPCVADASENSLPVSNFRVTLRYHSNGSRNLPLHRNPIRLLPYPPPPATPLTSDQIFGITIISFLAVQLAFGYYHHKRYIQDSPTYRRWFTYVHIWLGRILIICGLANAGCGLKLAFVDNKYVIAWWVTCGALAVIYALVSIFAWWTGDRKSVEGSGRSSPGDVQGGEAGTYNFVPPRKVE